MTPRLAAPLWGLAVAAAIVLPPLALRDRLPDPMATHWGPDAVADGWMPFTVNLAMQLALWGVSLAVLAAVAARGLRSRSSRVGWWAALAGLGVFATGMGLITTLANLDAPTWRDARLTGWLVVAVIVPATAAAVLAGHLGRGAPDERPAAGARPPRMRLRPGERVAWVSRAGNPGLAVATVGGAAVLATVAVLALAGFIGWAAAAIALPASGLVVVAGLLTSSLTARVTSDGLAIAFGPLGWPVRRVSLARIEQAWSETRHPGQVGGWGVRGLPGNVTIMLRGGECLVVRHRSGGTLAVSVDDAERGASLLNALIAERATV
jgi:hypothetical protein